MENIQSPFNLARNANILGDLGLFVGLFANMGPFGSKIPFLNGPEYLNFSHSGQIMGEIQTWSSFSVPAGICVHFNP